MESSESSTEPVDYHIGIDYEKVRRIIHEETKKTLIEFYYEVIKPLPLGEKPPQRQQK